MGVYRITGGVPLCGTVPIHGAKNAILPILAATLAVGGVCVLCNCPDITDVDDALALLQHLGCSSQREDDCIRVDTSAARPAPLPKALVRRMRAAVLFLGAMLARFSEASLFHPGGCPLGDRPINLHLNALRRMGADCVYDGDELHCTARRLLGATIDLPFPSVGATENILLAALACEGETILQNAAREPEITDLIGFLQKCGAEIRGAGTSTLRISGGWRLHGTCYRIVPDRVEAVTYLAACAATRGHLHLTGVCPAHLTAVLSVLRRGGCRVEAKQTELTISCSELQAVSPIVTAPYDGFPTDAQAPIMAAMATAVGTSHMEETVFSDRFCHVPALCKMGADIVVDQCCAEVRGGRLHGATVEATDLRGGAAMAIAAMAAEGESLITATEHIERGYTNFVPILRACGARIEMSEA